MRVPAPDTGAWCSSTNYGGADECSTGICAGGLCTSECDDEDDCVPGWECLPAMGLDSHKLCRCSHAAETCDGTDEDCSGVVDDGDADLSCSPANGPGYLCVDNACDCPSMCGNVCADLQRDENHCGSCDNDCAAGQVCEEGQCVPCAASCGPLEECYHDRCVAQLVALPLGFLMDATEVTRDQYAAWLATLPDETPYLPHAGWPPGAQGDHPVIGVDWVSAARYCEDVGKRLCRGDFDEPTNEVESEWFAVCENVFSGSAGPYECNDEQLGLGDTMPVASSATCSASDGPYAGIYDLVGNASEWESACNYGTGYHDLCLARGGDYGDDDAGCNKASQVLRSGEVLFRPGIRCCADP